MNLATNVQNISFGRFVPGKKMCRLGAKLLPLFFGVVPNFLAPHWHLLALNGRFFQNLGTSLNRVVHLRYHVCNCQHCTKFVFYDAKSAAHLKGMCLKLTRLQLHNKEFVIFPVFNGTRFPENKRLSTLSIPL